MKKKYPIIFSLTVLGVIFSGFFTHAAIDPNKVSELKDQYSTQIDNAKANVDFSQVQQASLKIANAAISQLQKAQDKISANKNLDQADKDTLNANLQKIENGLQSYASQIQAAQTLDELKTINQEMIAYLKANKNAIKKNFQAAINILANEILNTTQQLIAKAETMLNALKIVCQDDTASISQIQDLLNQLESEVAQLQEELNQSPQNSADLKKMIQKITTTSNQLLKEIQEISPECMDKIQNQ